MAENTEGEEETEEEFAIMYSITVVSQCCYDGIAVVIQCLYSGGGEKCCCVALCVCNHVRVLLLLCLAPTVSWYLTLYCVLLECAVLGRLALWTQKRTTEK
jgi:hypothetical protein